jgi:hypothetical protein
MTDFLTDLLERSRGLGSGLAPRIPSVFEPASGAVLEPASGAVLEPAGDAVLGPTGEEPVLPAARPQRSRPAAAWPEGRDAAPSRETVPPEPAPSPARAGSDGEIGPSAAGPAPPPAGTVAPQAEAIGGTERVLADVAVPRAEPAGRRPGLARPQLAATSRRGEQRVPLLAIEPETATRQRGTHARPAAQATPVAPHEHTAEPLPDGGPLPPPRPGMLMVPQPGAFAAPERPGPAAPAEPTVHVTIGRVEIRAVSAPAPPARRAQAARMMSLDEYLAERNQRRQA